LKDETLAAGSTVRRRVEDHTIVRGVRRPTQDAHGVVREPAVQIGVQTILREALPSSSEGATMCVYGRDARSASERRVNAECAGVAEEIGDFSATHVVSHPPSRRPQVEEQPGLEPWMQSALQLRPSIEDNDGVGDGGPEPIARAALDPAGQGLERDASGLSANRLQNFDQVAYRRVIGLRACPYDEIVRILINGNADGRTIRGSVENPDGRRVSKERCGLPSLPGFGHDAGQGRDGNHGRISHARRNNRMTTPRNSRRGDRSAVAALALVAVSFGGTACGDEAAPDPGQGSDALVVEALPPGSDFNDAIVVQLAAPSPSEIVFTTDGSLPSASTSRSYDGPIRITDSTLLTFMAVAGDGRRSEIQTEWYTRLERDGPLPELPARSLRVWPERLVFTPGPGVESETETVRLEAIGTEPVTIFALKRAPAGATTTSYDPEAFEIVPNTTDPVVRPGQPVELAITYFTTKTSRTMALTLETDADNASRGEFPLMLFGRMFP